MRLTKVLPFLALLLLAVPVAADDSEAAPGAKILLISTRPDHGWGTHMYEFECGFLAKMLRQTKGVEAVTSMYWPKEPEKLEGVTAIVWYSRPAGNFVLTPPEREPFLKLMKQGVGYVAIHWATETNAKLQEEYKELLGGYYRRPPGSLATTPSTLVQLDPNHPVCRGWKPFDFRDEYYLGAVLHERAKPLLEITTNGRKQVVGWAYERKGHNGGRSFGTTLAHFHDNFKIESFRRMLVNGILWAAHVEVPAEGASVKATEKDLELPPRPAKKK